MEYIRVSKENLEEHYLIYRTLVRQCSFLRLILTWVTRLIYCDMGIF